MTTQSSYAAGGSFDGTAGSDVPHQYASVAEQVPYELLPGLAARAVHGERVTLSVVDLEPDLEMAPHRHSNEQVGMVLRGEITFTIGDETRLRRTGDMWVIPPGVPHGVRVGPAGCTAPRCSRRRATTGTRCRACSPAPGRGPKGQVHLGADAPGGGSTPTPAFAAGVRPNASVPPGLSRP
jgi:quercetin dioxygenase-like cupin family protein